MAKTTTPQKPGLLARAADALADRKQAAEAAGRARAEKSSAQVAETLKRLLAKLLPPDVERPEVVPYRGSARAAVDGLTFTATVPSVFNNYADPEALYLVAPCPKCEEETLYRVETLADLAAQVAEPRPVDWHYCRPAEADQADHPDHCTPAERALLDSLAAFMVEARGGAE
jgi:hypothetical protein